MIIAMSNWLAGNWTIEVFISNYLKIICELKLQEAFGMHIFQCKSAFAWALDKHTFGSNFKIFPIFEIHHTDELD